MSCGCGKPRAPLRAILSDAHIIDVLPSQWGPCFWYAMHTLAERIGTTSDIINGDQATIFRMLIELLPKIIPCQECQRHARSYILANPIPHTWYTSKGDALRIAIRSWLFNFHTAVRLRLGQPVTIATEEACSIEFRNILINPDFITDISRYVSYAIRSGWVRFDEWKRWVVQFNRLKLLI